MRCAGIYDYLRLTFDHPLSPCNVCAVDVGSTKLHIVSPTRGDSNVPRQCPRRRCSLDGVGFNTPHTPSCSYQSNALYFTIRLTYHLPRGFPSFGKAELLPELSPHTPESCYSWPHISQVTDEVVSPYCFKSSLSSCPFSWCRCQSYSPSVVIEPCNVSRLSIHVFPS